MNSWFSTDKTNSWYKLVQTYTGITQDNQVANATRWVQALLISSTPSPSLLQSGNLPT